MKVHEIMTAHPRCIAPDNTLVEAAGLMRELDVGALPICDDDQLAGMVTDRDIVLRGTADGRDPNSTLVRDVMSVGVLYVFADQSVEEAARVMEEKQVRRLPVITRERRIVGIVSLGDVAMSSNPAFSGTALRDVSQPGHLNARQRRLAAQSEMGRMLEGAGGRGGSRAGGKKVMSGEARTSSRKAKSARSARTTRRRKQSTSARKSRNGGARSSRSRRASARAGK